MFPVQKLIPGKRYRIEHWLGLLYNRTGKYIESYNYNNYIFHDFDETVLSIGKLTKNIRCCYSANEWYLYEAASTIIAYQVARGLSYYIPEDTAGIIHEFLVGRRLPGTGRSKFPAR